jgi:hypothetical protein
MDVILHETEGPEGDAEFFYLPLQEDQIEGAILIRKKDALAPVASLDQVVWTAGDHDPRESGHDLSPL